MQTRSLVLKEGEMFALFDPYGDIVAAPAGEDGLYCRDTRHLSHAALRINNVRPVLLGSTVEQDDTLLVVDLSNPEFGGGAAERIPAQTLHVARQRLLWRHACLERLSFTNHASARASFTVQYVHDADFADIFEVRGARRLQRGRRLPGAVHDGCVEIGYEGLDRGRRTTRLTFDPAPEQLSPTSAAWTLTLAPGERRVLYVTSDCAAEAEVAAGAERFAQALEAVRSVRTARRSEAATVSSSNELFDAWIDRSAADAIMLVSDTEHGPYPVAGIPWYSTPFGRDALITALHCLWVDPSIARGVLGYLAATQASESDVAREAQPGKILHETRAGEMALLGEVPFERYYGTVDATPLFVALAGAWLERTGELAFLERIWPNIEAALGWLDTDGDADGDGFVEYERSSPSGLLNQGWKDSDDSVSHADGRLAEGAIALVEVQAYVYLARRAGARIAEALGHAERARTLHEQAEALQRRFEETYWCEELDTYALALDGDKAPCRVRSSNAGHALFAGIASPERARRVAATLMAPGSFSGWGIRTLDAREPRYNPMSYHNGSIWPHDNALIAMGFDRYGLRGECLQLLTALFDTALHADLHRLPELFCGFEREASFSGPVRYPEACAPQAWASSSAFALLGAALGLRFDAAESRLTLCRPRLPELVEQLEIRALALGSASVDIVCRRHRHDVSVNVLARHGEIHIVIEP